MSLQHEVEVNGYKCENLYKAQNESQLIKFTNKVLQGGDS